MSSNISRRAIVCATSGQASCDVRGEVVILHIDSGVYYGLDKVGAYIWELIQQPRAVDEVLSSMLKRYDAEPPRAEGDLINLLEELQEAGLINVKTGTSA